MWHSLKEKPTKDGIYIVAEFDGDKMVSYDTNWALCEGYWGPNNLGWQERINPTHWMTSEEYRNVLENLPKLCK